MNVNFIGNQHPLCLLEITDEPLELPPVFQQMLHYASHSVQVEIDSMLPTVFILPLENPSESDGWYMQEEEAQSFLDKAEILWNEYEITDKEAVMLAAYEYVDAM